MKSSGFKSFMRWWPAIVAASLLPACGGDGSIDSSSTNTSASTIAGVSAGAAFSTSAGIVATESAPIPKNTFTARLTGEQETPPVSSAATAVGIIMVDPATRVLKAIVTTVDIISTGVYLHAAPAGVAGPVIFPLTELSASGIWTGQATLTVAQLDALRAGNYYLNVRSVVFPNGELRGQIL